MKKKLTFTATLIYDIDEEWVDNTDDLKSFQDFEDTDYDNIGRPLDRLRDLDWEITDMKVEDIKEEKKPKEPESEEYKEHFTEEQIKWLKVSFGMSNPPSAKVTDIKFDVPDDDVSCLIITDMGRKDITGEYLGGYNKDKEKFYYLTISDGKLADAVYIDKNKVIGYIPYKKH